MIITLVIPKQRTDLRTPVEFDRIDYSVDGGHVPREGDQVDLRSAPSGVNPRGEWEVDGVLWIFTERGCAQVEVHLK